MPAIDNGPQHTITQAFFFFCYVRGSPCNYQENPLSLLAAVQTGLSICSYLIPQLQQDSNSAVPRRWHFGIKSYFRGDGTLGLKVTFSYGRPRALCLPELRQFTRTAVTGTLWHYPGAYLFLGEFWRVVIFVIDHDGSCGCACQSDVQSCHILSLNDQFILGIFQGLHSKETPEKTGFRSEAHCFGELASMVPMP